MVVQKSYVGTVKKETFRIELCRPTRKIDVLD